MSYKQTPYKKVGTALSLMGLSALLAACDVITAQHIPSSTTTAYNNGAGLGGRGAQMGMPGSFVDGPGLGGMLDGVVSEVFDADFVGRIVQIKGSSVKLEQVKQDSARGGGRRSPDGAADAQTEWTATGEMLTLTLGSEVEISSVDSSPGGEGRPEGTPNRGGREAAVPGAPTDSTGDPKTNSRTESRAGTGTDSTTGPSTARPGASSEGKITDLQNGQIILVWYKAGSKTVDRIHILQDASQ
ncbi:hypothetical protein B9G55_17035 [Saccharibacillus sp. O16]|nr:hypothetical protein B9G55_17035 [Saccharibacillus sp. O16]